MEEDLASYRKGNPRMAEKEEDEDVNRQGRSFLEMHGNEGEGDDMEWRETEREMVVSGKETKKV